MTKKETFRENLLEGCQSDTLRNQLSFLIDSMFEILDECGVDFNTTTDKVRNNIASNFTGVCNFVRECGFLGAFITVMLEMKMEKITVGKSVSEEYKDPSLRSGGFFSMLDENIKSFANFELAKQMSYLVSDVDRYSALIIALKEARSEAIENELKNKNKKSDLDEILDLLKSKINKDTDGSDIQITKLDPSNIEEVIKTLKDKISKKIESKKRRTSKDEKTKPKDKDEIGEFVKKPKKSTPRKSK